MKHSLTAFTPDGEYLAILSSAGTVKIWCTNGGGLLAEWKSVDGDLGDRFSCMACSFVGKKRRKETATFLLALATDDGDVIAVDVFSGTVKWRIADSFASGVAGLSFANKGRNLHVVGTNGIVSNMNSETGTVIEEIKASKKSVSTLAYSCDEKYLAVEDGRLRVLSLENGKEIIKFSNDLGQVQRVSLSDEANTVVTLASGEKDLQVWTLDKESGKISRGFVLSMKHVPQSFQCKDGLDGVYGTVVLAVSKSSANVWHLRSQLEEKVIQTKIVCKVNENETALQSIGSAKKGHVSIIAARLQDLETEKPMKVIISYGSVDHPQFNLVDISNPGEDIIVNASEETKSIPESGVSRKGLDATSPKKSKKASKKRAATDHDAGDIVDIGKGQLISEEGSGEAVDGVLVDDDLNEPTMEEKLVSLNLKDKVIVMTTDNDEAALAKPPSADSIHILLKQALHADDSILLSNCLYTQNENVIAKSVLQLNPSDILKFLQSLMTIVQKRGAIVAYALPWLRCLLLQHSSEIISQQSSLAALNSLYQYIEARVSTYQSTVQLSSALDVLLAKIDDDEEDESGAPVVFEDKDSSDEDDSGNESMEVDGGEEGDEELGELNDPEDSDGLNSD